jgi:hypothetical protein
MTPPGTTMTSPSPSSATPEPSPDTPLVGLAGDVAAWQEVLAAENAVIWSYGLVGATEGLAEPAADALIAHRERRAGCLEVVTAIGAEPVTSAPAYRVDKPETVGAGRRLAADLERSASVAYLSLTASADRATRLLAARWLRESAIMQARWSGEVPPMPGFDSGVPVG